MRILLKFILFVMLLLPILATAQTDTVPQSTYTEWQCANEGQFGSFWWYIERTDYKVDGYYYYYIYFYSNSYLSENGVNHKAISFIDAPTVTMYYNNKQNYVKYPMTSVLCDWEKTKACYISTIDPYAEFYIKWKSIYAYDYSIKK